MSAGEPLASHFSQPSVAPLLTMLSMHVPTTMRRGDMRAVGDSTPCGPDPSPNLEASRTSTLLRASSPAGLRPRASRP